jgi:hypothetical protein
MNRGARKPSVYNGFEEEEEAEEEAEEADEEQARPV